MHRGNFSYRRNVDLPLSLLIKSFFVHRYGRLTVATLESRLEAAQKEIEQMKRAMNLSDNYVASLEKDLKSYRGVLEGSQIKSEPDSPCVSTNNLFANEEEEPISGVIGESQPPCPPTTDVNCAVVYDETSKASSFFELQGLEDSFSSFTPPPPLLQPTISSAPQVQPCSPHLTSGGEGNLSFSRKLEFDPPDCASSSYGNTGCK